MTAPLRVLVAGGGVAGLEALLALHDLAGDRIEATLLAPDDDFVYRPLAVGEPFSLGHRERVPLADVARDAGAKLVRDGLERVDDAHHVVHTTSGDTLRYDALLVAIGARTEMAIEHASTWTPDADPGLLGGILRDIEEGYVKRLAFVVPTEAAWPLPAYELALMTAAEASGMGRDDLELIIVTPEDEPLGLFGGPASAAVRAKLDAAGIRVEAGSYVSESGHGMLRLEPGHRELQVDRVVALPRARGPAIPAWPPTTTASCPSTGTSASPQPSASGPPATARASPSSRAASRPRRPTLRPRRSRRWPAPSSSRDPSTRSCVACS